MLTLFFFVLISAANEEGESQGQEEVSGTVKGRYLFCLVFILGTAERGVQQSELIVAHSGKSSLALATHGYQMC